MIADEDAVDHVLKNPPHCDRSHDCSHGAAVYTFREWCLSYLWL